MAFNIKNFLIGIGLVPKSSTTIDAKGEMEVLSSDGKLNYHNGTTASKMVTENHASQGANRLTNKDHDDATTAIVDSSDTTKKIKFDAAGTTGTTTTITGSQTTDRTLTLPDATDTLVGKATTDTLTNKVLTGNTAVNLVSGSGTLTLNTSGTITVPNATDTLVGKNTTDTLTNKTLTSPQLNSPSIADQTNSTAITIPEVSTPSTPSLTNGKIYFKSDGFLYQLNDDGSEAKVGKGVDGFNYIVNPDFDSNALNWSAFNVAFSSGRPTGSITLTSDKLSISRVTSNVLRGTGSLEINVTTASGSQGHGVISDAFTIATADVQQVLNCALDYIFTLNPTNVDRSGTSTQTVELWIYNVNANLWYQTTSYRGINANQGYVSTTFQTDASVSNNVYRFALVINNAPSGVFKMNIDDVDVGPEVILLGNAVKSPQYAGFIQDYAGGDEPVGWKKCDGSSVLRATYPDLFAALGGVSSPWGLPDGTHFNLPDFRRKVAVGSGGSGTGTLGSSVGDSGGAETVTLTAAQIASHSHGISANTGTLTGSSTSTSQHQHTTQSFYKTDELDDDERHTGGHFSEMPSGGGVGASTQYTEMESSHTHNVSVSGTLTGGTTSGGGGDGSHNNIQPSAVVTKIIKLYNDVQTQYSSDVDTRIVATKVGGNAPSATTNNPIIFPTVVYDTVAAYSTVTGQFTANITGYYKLSGYISASAGNISLFGYVDNVQNNRVGTIQTGTTDAVISGEFQLNAGQTLHLGTGSASIDCDANSFVSFDRISGTAAISVNPSLTSVAPLKVVVTDANTTLVSGINAAFLDATSSIQTQLNNKQPLDTQLTDLATLSYASNALKVVRVNAGETGFELATSSGGVWGTITGTLSDQTDLNTALGLKALAASPTFTGVVSIPTTGDETAPPLAFTGDLDTGIFHRTNNEVNIAAGGQRIVDFRTTGVHVITGGVTAAGNITAGGYTLGSVGARFGNAFTENLDLFETSNSTPSASHIAVNAGFDHSLHTKRSDGNTGNIQETIFSQTSSVTVANTTLDTNLDGSGVGNTTLPADFFSVGKSLRIKGSGYYSSTGSPNITITVKLNGNIVLTTGLVVSPTDTNSLFEIDAVITCRTTGSPGTTFCQGLFKQIGSAPKLSAMVNTSTTSVTTTVTRQVTVAAQWDTASASNTITMTNLTIETI